MDSMDDKTKKEVKYSAVNQENKKVRRLNGKRTHEKMSRTNKTLSLVPEIPRKTAGGMDLTTGKN